MLSPSSAGKTELPTEEGNPSHSIAPAQEFPRECNGLIHPMPINVLDSEPQLFSSTVFYFHCQLSVSAQKSEETYR